MSDKHFASVGLLLGFEGSDGSTTFLDDGATGHTVTANGNAQIDTAQFKFGASSGLFDGNGDFLTTPDHADWVLGNLQFTIEGFVRFAGLNTGERGCCLLAHYADSGDQRSWGLYYDNDGGSHNLAFIRSPDGVNTTTLNGPWPGGAPALNTWYHIAADRDLEDILRVYVLGQAVGQADLTGFTFHDSTDLLNVGRLNSTSGFRRFMHGWIDELRFTKGVARYAGSFVPPQGPFSRYKALGVARPARPVVIGMALEPQPPLFAGAVARKTTSQSIPNNTFTKLTFDAEDYDDGGWHGPSNNSRLTVRPAVSVVKVFAGIQWGPSNSGDRLLRLTRNGSDLAGPGLPGQSRQSPNGPNRMRQCFQSPPLEVEPGDYFELEAWQSSGGSLDAEADPETFFGIMAAKTTRRALLRLDSNFAISGTLAYIDWDAADYDTDGFWSAGAPSRLTIPAGVSRVRLFACIRADSTAITHLFCNIDRNGSSFLGGGALEPDAMASPNRTRVCLASAVVAVTEGDYFEVQTRANTSANIQASENTYFGLEVVEQSEMSSALVRMSANQTIPASTQTVVDWGSEVHDDAGYPTRLTVPAGVDVAILTAYAAFTDNNTGDRWIEIRKNGSDTVAGMLLPESPVSDNDRVYAQSPPLKAVAGDYFEVLVWRGSGGDLDLLDANTTFFSIEGLPA